MTTCPIGPTCTGCAKCDAAYHTKRAAKRALRSAIDYTPPDPWEKDLARLRRDLPSNAWPEPAVVPPPAPGDYSPPDPYQQAIRERLEQEAARRNR